MKYILYGLDQTLITNEIKELKKIYQIEDIDTSHYDLDLNNLKEILDDAKTTSMFSVNKMIIVTNSKIFTTVKNEIEHDLNELLLYLENNCENTILVFTVNCEKLDERKKITKLINNKIELNKFNLDQIIKEKTKEYKFDIEALDLFKDKSGNDTGNILNELDKLMIYRYDTKHILLEDVDLLTTNNKEIDIFKLIDLIVLKKVVPAIEMYRLLIQNQESPIKILITLANQFRLMYQVKEYLIMGLSETEIASKLKIHPYRVKLAKEKSSKYTKEILLNLLSKLAQLDYNIKSGLIDEKIGFELFIMEV